jgi:hypothetical protein
VTVAKVLYDAKGQQRCQITRFRIPLKRDLLEQDGSDRIHHPIEKGNDEKQKSHVQIQRSHNKEQEHYDVAKELKSWTKELDKDEVRHRREPYDSVARIKKHFSVNEHRIQETSVPSISLAG